MGYAIIAFDGTGAEAPARRLAARDAHVAFITGEAAGGRLVLGLPLHDEGGRSLGSLMIVDVADRLGLDAYLAAEPFANRDVWRSVTTHPFRVAPLPYAPWPTPGSAMPGPRSHTIIVAMDAKDENALTRRIAARPLHFERVRSIAEEGTLLFGGAILDAPDGKMTGSIAITRHTDHANARRFWAEDPYVKDGVWHDMAFYGTLLRTLPYKPLPR